MAGRGEGTGVFLVLEEEACSSVRVAVPESFRFGDANPVNGKPYAESCYRDLPEYAAVVVRDHLDLEPGSWNVLVEDREVPEWVDLDTAFTTGAVRVPEQRRTTRVADTGAGEVAGIGHAQEFHARRSRHPGYTWEQYKRDVARDRGRRFQVVEVSSLDAAEAWL